MCVCVCVCVCVVCVFLKLMCLSVFVSALGSHEMGRHKLPFIFIIITHGTEVLALAWRFALSVVDWAQSTN